MYLGFLVYQKQQTLSVKSGSEIQPTASVKFINEKSATVLRKFENTFKLSWSHYLLLIKINHENLMNYIFYRHFSAKSNIKTASNTG